MNISLIFLIVLGFGTKLVEYRFYNNYGQIFNDYSGNNWTAVNGISSSDLTDDIIATDRGAYFGYWSVQNWAEGGGSIYTGITLPKNDVITTKFALPPIFSMIIWCNFVNLYNKANIFTKYLDVNHKFFIRLTIEGKIELSYKDSDKSNSLTSNPILTEGN